MTHYAIDLLAGLVTFLALFTLAPVSPNEDAAIARFGATILAAGAVVLLVALAA
jgi:hypothetical protein